MSGVDGNPLDAVRFLQGGPIGDVPPPPTVTPPADTPHDHQGAAADRPLILGSASIAGMAAMLRIEAAATEALGEEMWDLVNGITGALADLGTLDRVTRERLFAVLFDRIRRAGIQ